VFVSKVTLIIEKDAQIKLHELNHELGAHAMRRPERAPHSVDART
jgi:hypothetical protein